MFGDNLRELVEDEAELEQTCKTPFRIENFIPPRHALNGRDVV